MHCRSAIPAAATLYCSHGPDDWRAVGRVMPDHERRREDPRQLLRRGGPQLPGEPPARITSPCRGVTVRLGRFSGGARTGGSVAPSGGMCEELKVALRDVLRFLVINAVLVRERWQSGATYNPFSPRMAQDPYPDYAKLRARSPRHRSRLMNAWVFSRYEDVDAILRDHRSFSSDPRKRELSPRQQATLPAPDEYTILFLDPPDHTRLRALVNKAFTRRAVSALEPLIRSFMETLLDEIADPTAGFDLMKAVAHPLPVIVIAEMLGVPPKDRARFRMWSNRRARLIEPTITAREREIAVEAGKSLNEYFLPIIQTRRLAPENDIISSLAQAEEGGDTLTECEMLNLLRLLLVAGNETTTNLIGNGMLALLRHPEELERLREDRSLIPAAVEELLRYDSPVQATFRGAARDCEVNGFPIPSGRNVMVLIGSANRDPAAFDDPNRLDIGRDKSSHISLGRGIHHCLGAHLARLEGRIAFEVLLERFSSMRLLTDHPTFRNGIVLRGLESLPVRAVPA